MASQPVVIVAGGGVAGLEGVAALRSLAGDRVAITLLAPEPEFVYRPLSVGEPFSMAPARRYPLAQIAHDFAAELHPGALAGVDPGQRRVRTSRDDQLRYDMLLVALGARREPAFPSGITFRGQEDVEAVHGLVQDVELGYATRVHFLVPGGVAWSLPIYELALLTASRAFEMGMEGVELTLATPEPGPLAIFGPAASAEVRGLLEHAGVRVHTSVYPMVSPEGEVVLRPGEDPLPSGRIVAMPQLRGIHVPGLPGDERGFIPIDPHGRVIGLEDVYAAGDGTGFPVKQGGIAAQQADAAAASIAAAAGAPVEPEPFRPVLRGRLLTGAGDRFLSHAIAGGGGEGRVSEGSLWWPPSKVVSTYLSPYLAAADLREEGDAAAMPEVPLDLDVTRPAGT
jgi:sulfide:quinone oxidoreductase